MAEHVQTIHSTEPVSLLVVDDNEISRMLMVELLKNTDAIIDMAPGGMECLEMVQMKKYDCIFMDHLMPQMDGIECLKRLVEIYTADQAKRDTNSLPPVVLVTGTFSFGENGKYKELGFSDFLAKPVTKEALYQVCEKYIPGLVKNENSKDEFDFLTQLEGIDSDYVRSHVTSAELYQKIARNFYYTYEREVSDLNTENYGLRMHSFKSTLLSLGNVMLSGAAGHLEAKALECSDASEILNVREKYRPLENNFFQKLEAFRAGLGQIYGFDMEKEIKRPYREMVVKTYLDCLAEAMAEMDVDTADGAISELANYDFDEVRGKQFEMLRIAVENLDQSAVKHIIDEWR